MANPGPYPDAAGGTGAVGLPRVRYNFGAVDSSYFVLGAGQFKSCIIIIRGKFFKILDTLVVSNLTGNIVNVTHRVMGRVCVVAGAVDIDRYYDPFFGAASVNTTDPSAKDLGDFGDIRFDSLYDSLGAVSFPIGESGIVVGPDADMSIVATPIYDGTVGTGAGGSANIMVCRQRLVAGGRLADPNNPSGKSFQMAQNWR